MNQYLIAPGTLRRSALALGLCAIVATVSGQAAAGCGMYSAQDAAPPNWTTSTAASAAPSGLASPQSGHGGGDGGGNGAGIVGLWKFTFVSDGSAYPTPIPSGVIVDFGTTQWHSDGTEILFSGSRPPSTGDVCMGVWQQTGSTTYKLKHIALAWISSDTPPPIGPAVPAVFVGPAIVRQAVTLNRARNGFEGTFTVDQYAKDEITLLQHVAGKVTATRVTVD